MKKALVAIVLIALLYIGWTKRDRVMVWLGRDDAAASVAAAPSQELAERAEAKLDDLKEGRVSSVSLHANELQSLLQYRFQQLLPAFVDQPEVELAQDRIEVRAQVPVEQLPSLNELGEAASFLPDTAEVGLTGTLLPLERGRVALVIERVSAARIPLPQRLVPRALRQLGRRDEPGLPQNALALPLPPGAASAEVRGDTLVLLAQPNSRSNN